MKNFPQLLDDIDQDLNLVKWSRATAGYAKRSVFIGMKDGKIKTRTVFAHRVVAERMFGDMRGKITDHINGDKLDNRRRNLRITDMTGNAQNRTPHSRSGMKGVYETSFGKWSARIFTSTLGIKKGIFIGNFKTKEEANIAVMNERIRLGLIFRQ